MINLAPKVLAVLCCLSVSPSHAAAEDLEGLTWTEQKCVLYQRAVTHALRFLGPEDIRDEFISRNDEFIAGGCLARGNVCPITDKEFEFANLLTVMTMNEGMASTFVPFSCRN